MSTTHTHAPWGIAPSAAQAHNPASVRVDIVCRSDATPFSNGAFIAGDILPEDARLMVAAPDLADALDDCAGVLQSFENQLKGKSFAVTTVLAKARAALAKIATT